MNEESSGYREKRKLPQRCGQDNCPSKVGYVQDGLLYCRNGHLQPDFQEIVQDEVERFGASKGQTTRKIKVERERQSRGFPEELEQCTKDLWALRLPQVHEAYGSKLRTGDTEESADNDSDNIQQTQVMYSSQPQLSSSELGPSIAARRKRQLPAISDSLALLYISSMLLRIPIGIGRLYRWVASEEIPFVQIHQHIPFEVRQNLETPYQILLQTKSLPKEEELQYSIQNIVLLYVVELRVPLPPLNYEPLLFEHIQSLALPLQLYLPIKYLASLTNEAFAFPNENKKNFQLPEAVLVALIVIATKLFYPFPPAPNLHARSAIDPSFLSHQWHKWSDIQGSRFLTEADSSRPSFYDQNGFEKRMVEEDVFNLSDSQMDAYMDWYAKMFIPQSEANSAKDGKYAYVSSQIQNMFPMQHESSVPRDEESLQLKGSTNRANDRPGNEFPSQNLEDIKKQVISLIQSLQPRKIVNSSTINGRWAGSSQIGTFYQVFKKNEELLGIALDFHQQLANRAGLSLSLLIHTVRKLERRIEMLPRDRLENDNIS